MNSLKPKTRKNNLNSVSNCRQSIIIWNIACTLSHHVRGWCLNLWRRGARSPKGSIRGAASPSGPISWSRLKAGGALSRRRAPSRTCCPWWWRPCRRRLRRWTIWPTSRSLTVCLSSCWDKVYRFLLWYDLKDYELKRLFWETGYFCYLHDMSKNDSCSKSRKG